MRCQAMRCLSSADGKKFVYSGDTQYSDALAPFAANADLFLMEAAFLSKNHLPDAAHVSARQAGRIAADANVGRLLITHIFPEYDEADILAEAAEAFPHAAIIEELHTYEV